VKSGTEIELSERPELYAALQGKFRIPEKRSLLCTQTHVLTNTIAHMPFRVCGLVFFLVGSVVAQQQSSAALFHRKNLRRPAASMGFRLFCRYTRTRI
jgi:hypothetical protein